MLAARWHGRGDVRVETVERPTPNAGEVLLEVGWCGICGTDVEEYVEGPITIPVGAPNAITGRQAPLTLGHEFGGRVIEVGNGVSSVARGDRVAVEVCLSCGECAFCRTRRMALCSSWAAYGLQADGGLAEFVVVGADRCLPRPSSIDDRTAALVEPVEVAIRAVRKLAVQPGDSAAVLGGGAIGLLAAQVLRAAGARPVLVITGQSLSIDVARQLQLDVIDRRQNGWEGHLRDRTGALGPEVVIEAQGRGSSIGTAIRIARKGGRIVITGIVVGDHPIDVVDLAVGEKHVMGSIQHEREADLRPALGALADGSVQVEPLITGEIPLDRLVPDGLETLAGADRRHVKLLVRTH